MAIDCHETPRLEDVWGELEMFFHVLLEGGEWPSSFTGLGSTSDTTVQIRGWVDHTGVFSAVKRGFASFGKRNIYSAVVHSVSWPLCFFFLAREPSVGHGPLIHEVSRSHTTTHHSR
jgi:hypothetical protein